MVGILLLKQNLCPALMECKLSGLQDEGTHKINKYIMSQEEIRAIEKNKVEQRDRLLDLGGIGMVVKGWSGKPSWKK